MTLGHSQTGSGSDLVNDGVKNRRKYRMPITDQVATAPCTDCVQAGYPTFEASPQAWPSIKVVAGT